MWYITLKASGDNFGEKAYEAMVWEDIVSMMICLCKNLSLWLGIECPVALAVAV